MKLIFLIPTFIILLPSCTENQRAKGYGGTATVNLPPGTKFVGATWKEDALWFSYRPTAPGETPTVITLQEQSSFGLVEGKVVFQEK